ncbi:MAG: toll/interleukin-1 receptor domain-containing protein [Anaeroplasmataceae bacterium]|nr:toll/interleukin-1 receptor domain-containing protein [Anaeroplasmataceae bacterium]MDE6414563.1 toll/interleukin-1 receptor domain-containing protein [Anaeroplasmataceae bacterium]
MDVFISYRRDGALDLAGRLYEKFINQGYSAFYDIESMNEGKFNEQIFKKIEKCLNFLLILPPNGLDRCINPDDWVRKEIRKAMELNKNIVLVFLPGFEFPKELPDDIKDIKQYQGVHYSFTMFKETYEKILEYLKDSKGGLLRASHNKEKSNTYYESIGMSEFERMRIKKDRDACKSIEDSIFEEMLYGKENIVLFNPAVYDVDTVMEKYSLFPQIKKVYGFVCNQKTADEANEKYGDENHKFYAGNMEDKDFEEKMEFVLSDNMLYGFDFVELTLILKDSENPFQKLQKIVEMLNDEALIYVRELDDDMIIAYPDDNLLISQMLKIIKHDKFSGSRTMGRKVYTLLKQSGASKVKQCNQIITTAGLNSRKRKTLFDTYFSYVEPEIDDLLKIDPDNDILKKDKQWLIDNYQRLERLFLSNDFYFISGFQFFYAVFNEED